MIGAGKRRVNGVRRVRFLIRRRPALAFFAAAVAWIATITLVSAMAGAGPPRSAGAPFAPRPLPDRIVLTPGADPRREMAVAYRTDPEQLLSEAEIAPALDGPTLQEVAASVLGSSPPRRIDSRNGPALYHQIRFSGLEPDTVYAYRLKGAAGWSEWHQFKTAAVAPRPFRFLYLGDMQNRILADGARVVRQAFRDHGRIELVLHAGDLVDQRDDLDHDDEWGEWNAAAGYLYAGIPQMPAAGNHEYDNVLSPNRGDRRRLGAYWPLQFALPANGSAAAKATTYFVDYQGVRFVVLDGTSALDLKTAENQARWLDRTLAGSKATWNVVLFHQPIFSCARPEDSAELKAVWKPILDRRKVDLVLQGHDHCYSRLSTEGAGSADEPRSARGEIAGPVYMVSIAGAKMYGLNDRTALHSDRAAEATQLYQIVDATGERLRVRVYTATGRLYDGFDIERGPNGRNIVRETGETLIAERRCEEALGPDGTTCGVRTKKAALFGR